MRYSVNINELRLLLRGGDFDARRSDRELQPFEKETLASHSFRPLWR